jgi:hypothetical protein
MSEEEWAITRPYENGAMTIRRMNRLTQLPQLRADEITQTDNTPILK